MKIIFLYLDNDLKNTREEHKKKILKNIIMFSQLFSVKVNEKIKNKGWEN